MVRNNELKNYVKMLGDETSRITMDLCVDLKEPLIRVEGIIEQELPGIRAALCAKVGENAKLKYRGVQGILDSGKRLSFAIYCDGVYFGRAKRLLNRELLLMCERNEIQLAMPQVVVHEAGAVHPDSDDTAAE
jgi:small-conductance mechanosensitive channel